MRLFVDMGTPVRVVHFHLPAAGAMSYWQWPDTGILIHRSDMLMPIHPLRILQRFFRCVISRQRRLAVVMAYHPRLGADSPFATLPSELAASFFTPHSDAVAPGRTLQSL